MATTVTLLDRGSRLTYTTELVAETCCVCGVPFAWPREMREAALKDHSVSFWCPSGHSQYFTGKTEEEKLREQLDASRRRADMAEQAARISRGKADEARRSASAYKGVATRQRKRIGRGACPCCNHHFANVEQHMESQHPGWAQQEVTTAD
jgi:hypothetical protein